MLKIVLMILNWLLMLYAQSTAVIKNSDAQFQGEKYVYKEVAFIPWGKADSLLGFEPSMAETNELGDTVHVEPGTAVRSWDIDVNGKIYVADEIKGRVSIYDVNGSYLMSIGDRKSDTDEIIVTKSGREIMFRGKRYFTRPMDVAVDSDGDVYLLPDIDANYIFQFSEDGRLTQIVDKFGEYGPGEIRDTDILFSDTYGHIYVNFGVKPKGRLTAEFDNTGNLVSIGRYYPKDGNGNLYEMLTGERSPYDLTNSVSFAVSNSTRKETDTFTIYFKESSGGIGFQTVDSDGNLYLTKSWALLKYDQRGNLLTRISSVVDTVRTFKHDMSGMAASSKIMANGDIYNAYMSDQGFMVVKYELQPETKGQILEPAYIPEDMKK